MICNRCKNDDTSYFYQDEFGIYCRKCIEFGRFELNQSLKPYPLSKINKKIKYHLNYSLTSKQEEIAQKTINALQTRKNVVIHACCGSGKTEILIPVIQYLINNNKKVGLAIPRRQVALELKQRLEKVFPELEIVAVCKDYTRKLKGDLIICTTHQLFRYVNSFDVLILDEIDAFPFHNNEVLIEIAKNSYKENIVALSATMDHNLFFQNYKVFQLFERYHKRKLIVPSVIILPLFFQFLYLILFIKKNIHLTILIFIPTIELLNSTYFYLSRLFTCFKISSESENKEQILDQLNKSKIRILLTTTIMERGITIADACVIVIYSNHTIFNEASLIQIAGRVDRKPISYNGTVTFLCSKNTKSIRNCIYKIKEMNK